MSKKAKPRLLLRNDRLRALMRNPDVLLDLEFVKKGVMPTSLKYENGEPIKREDLKRVDPSSLREGFSARAVDWFLEKYKLSVMVTPELIEKYPFEVWEQTPVFADDDQGVRPLFKEKPCISENGVSTLTIEIDLPPKNMTETMEKVRFYIDHFGKDTRPPKSRKKGDQKVDRFFIWDEYKKYRHFSQIATKLKVDRATVRKAYLRAFEDIMGEKYDPAKHDRRHLQKVELDRTCDKCPNNKSCDTICPDALAFIKQDERPRKELLLLDILPSNKPSDHFV